MPMVVSWVYLRSRSASHFLSSISNDCLLTDVQSSWTGSYSQVKVGSAVLVDDDFRFSFDQCTPLEEGQNWHSLELTLLLNKIRDLFCSRKWVMPCVSKSCSLVRCNEAQLPSQSCGSVRAIADLPLNGCSGGFGLSIWGPNLIRRILSVMACTIEVMST